MTPPDPATQDPAAAELERIRERHAARTKTDVGIGADPEDAARLLAAVERLSKLADEWDADAAELDRDIARAHKSPHSSDHHQARTDEAVAGELRGCAAKVREAITTALTGKDPDHA